MQQNFHRSDLDAVKALLSQDDPRLTQGTKVREFEAKFSEWLGVKHSVFVNSGSSANLLTMHALKELRGPGKVVVPTLTWSSDITSVLHAGLEPVFVDVDRRTLGMDGSSVAKSLKDERPLAIFPTHCMGYNAFNNAALDVVCNKSPEDWGPVVIEDCCEAVGAINTETLYWGKKVGSFGLASNFSTYYAHHMTTIEGGIVATDDDEFARTVRMLRGHGMTRECGGDGYKRHVHHKHPDLNPEFVFALPGFNCRNTEIGAVLGIEQLKRLDENNAKRNENLKTFLQHLDPEVYQTDFAIEGCSSYAFTLVLQRPDTTLRDAVEGLLRRHGVEFRRGVAGGGNQLRQPYLKRIYGEHYHERFPVAEHIHHYGWYVGNHPGLEREAILRLCEELNELAPARVAS
jgi:CDP-6-deoxy-D-xylo-4-hexulose-3-dehydrase